jgi:hypothetical protein
MRDARWSLAGLVVALSLGLAGHAGAQSGPTLSKVAAAEGFYLDVARCLYSLEHSGGIEGLPAEAKADLRPATAAERSVFRDPAIKVWTTDAYGTFVLLGERTPDRCEVVAQQVPVDATFQAVMRRLQNADPNLAPRPVKPGYNPIAYQLERTANGQRFIVHLEGAEPSGAAGFLSGHTFRYSLLSAFVSRQPDAVRPVAPAGRPRDGASPSACSLTLPDHAAAQGGGTVTGFEDREKSLARVAEVEKSVGGRIDPAYADSPRVVVKLDGGRSQIFIAPAGMQVQLGDRVTLQGGARNPALPCHYVPPLIVADQGA